MYKTRVDGFWDWWNRPWTLDLTVQGRFGSRFRVWSFPSRFWSNWFLSSSGPKSARGQYYRMDTSKRLDRILIERSEIDENSYKSKILTPLCCLFFIHLHPHHLLSFNQTSIWGGYLFLRLSYLFTQDGEMPVKL